MQGGETVREMPGVSIFQHVEQVRRDCIQRRRCLCGRILKITAEGLVIESGYTNLLREPLTRSWLVPGTVTARRPANLIEGHQPDGICVGKVFLTDIPKSRPAKPKVGDYVIMEAYPEGETSYVSAGTIRRSVRKFTAVLEKSVNWNLEQELGRKPRSLGN